MAKARKTKAAASTILRGDTSKPTNNMSSTTRKTEPDSKPSSKPSVTIPKEGFAPSRSKKTPKTPADEGLEFFESAVVQADVPIQVYELRLHPDGGPSKELSYIRLPPPCIPYVLRVSLEAGTAASKNGVFKTNFPIDGGEFGRFRFAERKIPTDFSKPIKVDLPISHAGAFVYWVEYDGDKPGKRVKGREGYFNIDPILRIKERSPIISQHLNPLSSKAHGGAIKDSFTNIPLDGLVVLTVVSKWMGKFDEWRPYLQEATERGYNMLHYTPLQQRGQSGSPYSIADQLAYDSALFPVGWKGSDDQQRDEMKKMLKIAKNEYGLLSLIDVVLNHTADNSAWLVDHPEAGYSPSNTPHLTPALELDTAMITFSASLASKGLPTKISSAADVDTLMSAFKEELRAHNFWQYYVLDVKHEKDAVVAALASVQTWDGAPVAGKTVAELAELIRSSGKLDESKKFHKRYGVTVDPKYAAGLVKATFAGLVKEPGALGDAWVRVVDVLNVNQYKEWEEDTRVALENIKNRITYTRLDEHGPKLWEITEQVPIVESYFTRIKAPKHDPSVHSVANNGWIWNADPLQNFALPPSKSYLRREVIAWGDCVKLRYGTGPKDNPWLWQYMTDYVCSLAGVFDGFRIDNCHSTPLHVGVALLDAARVVNPDLYVCAELFTGNEDTDTHFVSRLGINSLIREAYNAWDTKELSRLLYRHGLGKPIGSMDAACLTNREDLPPPTGKGPSRPCVVTPLQGSLPHALFFDLTHDNESPLHKRSAEDALSTGSLVTFSHCGIGSVKAFDDLYPKLLNLVQEERKYKAGSETGIGRVKHVLNHLHTEMVLEGYSEGHVHQENDYIVMHRVQQSKQKGYLLVAHTAFSKGSKDRGWIKPIRLRKTKAQFVLGASIEIPSYDIHDDPKFLTGLPSTLVDLLPVEPVEGTDGEGSYSEIIVPENFPPGSIMLFKTQMEGIDADLDTLCASGAEKAFGNLDLVDLNAILYRAEGEERDATGGEIGAYDVPGMGKLVYCGLEGWMHPLRHIMQHNDLGHPLCGHLRDGVWAMDYIHSRLIKQVDVLPNLAKPAAWFKERFDKIKGSTPPFLRPKYFAIVISEAYKAARSAAVEQCSSFVSSGHSFTQDLAMCSIQMYGLVKSASLDPAKPVPSLAAGLPHFTSGWARTWGRDVFISLRGLFLTTGNFEAAKKHILAFASTLKHGLIPNLLDSVRNPRYNSRDSPWWMLQNIQDYVSKAPDGLSLLSESVKRRFPKDESWVPWDDPRAYTHSSTIAEIIQEILQRHATGISFREYNAGPNLDMQMRDAGFNIDIHVDWSTGIIFGGSQYNCGTWMDKMGESERAGTKGVPGTPRDGAPIEITGLLKSTLRWLEELSTAGKFPFKGVEAEMDGKKRLVTYKEWGSLLQTSFENCYYVPLEPADDAKYHVNSSIINRRGIYKDVFGSGKGREWSDYQLRPNFPIAMTVAPELFDKDHALEALKLADKILRAPLGMKTLDPIDSQYRPHYDNSNDSDDGSIAKGLNYHQGPEWGWPLGYFLRAYMHFDLLVGSGKNDKNATLHHLHQALLPSRHHIQRDPWAGLPELTNKDGAYCHDSCNTQAWSASTMLDFLEDVHGMCSRS
ncbi:glycoside hydrolase family 13 protein [Rickenella mellea]|uniref:Glycogen debranching enzyme n=1 Tax=Rickenella mellea TaxID=50990 RepID=A0A4Y7Q866_9AGAM|nr:glycoside hydrolase family 13 protein [Rickenella mellea]